MKKRLFIFGLILIICFSSFNFAFAELSSDTGYKFIDLTIADRVNSGKIPSAVYNSEAWKTISRDKIPELPPISVTSAEFSRNGLTGTVHFDGDYIITMSVGNSGAFMKLMYLGEYWATNYDEDEKVYTDELISISANPDTLAGLSSRGEEFKSIYNNSTKTWSAWERTSSTPYNGNCFNLGTVVYTNTAIHTQRAYNPDTDKKQSDYLGLSGIYNIEYPPCIEPDKPTMYLHNVTDPLTDDFYLGVNNTLYRNCDLKVTYRRNKDDEYDLVPGGTASVPHGYYEFNKSNLGITDTGEYLFSLFDNGKLICICELTLTQRNYDGEPTMELCNVNTPLDDSFYLSVNNPMGTTCVLKVTYQATSDDEFTSICTQDIEYSRTYNLTKQDLAMKKDGNYLFSLFDSFGNLLIVKKLDGVVLVNGGGNGSADGNNNFGLAFNYPELPDNANVIDYIKWFCQCVVITFQSIGIVILEFSTSCSNFVRMITRFLNFMPKEFLVLLPIVLTVCVILRFLGR